MKLKLLLTLLIIVHSSDERIALPPDVCSDSLVKVRIIVLNLKKYHNL